MTQQPKNPPKPSFSEQIVRRHVPQKRVLAVSSGGGHWIQLMRMRPAFDKARVTYVSVDSEQAADVAPSRFYRVPEGNRDTKLSLIWMALRLFIILLITRPHVVISTGAAQGYFACRMGRWFGARTLFVDSVANGEQLTLSAQLSTRHATRVLSQWESVARKHGVDYRGSCL